ncbi:hypothetical protein LR007_01345 [candidate division NPL-UPA2 bacterium]|nr:hypothetical protein [candidate division NPL-UPA2 bacterium]
MKEERICAGGIWAMTGGVMNTGFSFNGISEGGISKERKRRKNALLSIRTNAVS